MAACACSGPHRTCRPCRCRALGLVAGGAGSLSALCSLHVGSGAARAPQGSGGVAGLAFGSAGRGARAVWRHRAPADPLRGLRAAGPHFFLDAPGRPLGGWALNLLAHRPRAASRARGSGAPGKSPSFRRRICGCGPPAPREAEKAPADSFADRQGGRAARFVSPPPARPNGPRARRRKPPRQTCRRLTATRCRRCRSGSRGLGSSSPGDSSAVARASSASWPTSASK